MKVDLDNVELVLLIDILEDFKERDKRFHFLNFNTSALIQNLSEKFNKLYSDNKEV